jgi:hypothetical protein
MARPLVFHYFTAHSSDVCPNAPRMPSALRQNIQSFFGKRQNGIVARPAKR